MQVLDRYNWNVNDDAIWRWTSMGKYTVKSAYNYLNFSAILCPSDRRIWKVSFPNKVRILV